MLDWNITKHRKLLKMVRQHMAPAAIAVRMGTSITDIYKEVEKIARVEAGKHIWGATAAMEYVHEAPPGFTERALSAYYKKDCMEGNTAFYAIYGGGKARTREEAEAEARKLAVTNPGEAFYVMKAISKFELATVVETELK